MIRILALIVAAMPVLAAELLVLNKAENSLAFVDPSSGKVLGRVPTGEGPHEIVVSADGRLAFAANYGSQTPGSTISVIDIAARKELRRVDLGVLRRPHGVAVSGGKVYFTAEANKLIGRYDPTTNQIEWLMGTGQNGTHMVYPSRDGNTLFTANIGSDSISAFTAPAWNQTVIPVGKGPEGCDFSPDGTQLWAAHSRDGGVSIIDVAGRKVIHTLDLHTRRSNRLKFTPDGRHVFVSDMEAGEVVVVDAGARKEVKRLKVGRSPEGILMPPGAAVAYVAVSGDNDLAMVDLKTLEVTRRIPTGRGPDGMAWVER